VYQLVNINSLICRRRATFLISFEILKLKSEPHEFKGLTCTLSTERLGLDEFRKNMEVLKKVTTKPSENQKRNRFEY